jgi:hypothetical protein
MPTRQMTKRPTPARPMKPTRPMPTWPMMVSSKPPFIFFGIILIVNILPISLTKYCQIFADAKECFGKVGCDNILGLPVMQRGENGQWSPCSLRICVSKIDWNREISLKTQYINQLDRLLQMVVEATSARAPSQFGFKNRSTINWKLAIEV